jgi:hypothetical protein
MYGAPDDDLWKIETWWICNVLIIKSHIDIVHLVGCNKTVHQIMQRMNNNNTIKNVFVGLNIVDWRIL